MNETENKIEAAISRTRIVREDGRVLTPADVLDWFDRAIEEARATGVDVILDVVGDQILGRGGEGDDLSFTHAIVEGKWSEVTFYGTSEFARTVVRDSFEANGFAVVQDGPLTNVTGLDL